MVSRVLKRLLDSDLLQAQGKIIHVMESALILRDEIAWQTPRLVTEVTSLLCRRSAGDVTGEEIAGRVGSPSRRVSGPRRPRTQRV